MMAGSKKVFATLGSSNHVPEEREAFDYYATDPKAVEMLLELEQFAPVIWEPACGEGHISKVLQAHGYQVISTDLVYRGFGDPEPLDFLKETLDGFEGDIITNPPYSTGQTVPVPTAFPQLWDRGESGNVSEGSIFGRTEAGGLL